MSIKSFSTQPCPTCGTDTMHYKMMCRECGHVNQTNYEAQVKLHRSRMLGRKSRGMTTLSALADMHKHDREIAAAKRREAATWAITPKGRS